MPISPSRIDPRSVASSPYHRGPPSATSDPSHGHDCVVDFLQPPQDAIHVVGKLGPRLWAGLHALIRIALDQELLSVFGNLPLERCVCGVDPLLHLMRPVFAFVPLSADGADQPITLGETVTDHSLRAGSSLFLTLQEVPDLRACFVPLSVRSRYSLVDEGCREQEHKTENRPSKAQSSPSHYDDCRWFLRRSYQQPSNPGPGPASSIEGKVSNKERECSCGSLRVVPPSSRRALIQ